MLNLQTIHEPQSLGEALQRLQQPDTVVMAGGTDLIAARRRDVRAVVSLSRLGLDGVQALPDGIYIGAATTLAQAADAAVLRQAADGVLASAAHRTRASILRNQATIAGTLVAEPDGVLAVTLLALEARLRLATLDGTQVATSEIPFRDFLARRKQYLDGAIVTTIIVPAASSSRRARLETVARTPRDKPIVSACAALEVEGGIVRACGLALGGVADGAWRAADAERELLNQGLTDDVIERAAMAAASGLNPPADFRGSAAYRTDMARVLSARALRALGAALLS